MAPLTRSKTAVSRSRVETMIAAYKQQRSEAANIEAAASAIARQANKDKKEAEKKLKAAKAAKDKAARQARVARDSALPVRGTRSQAKRR